MTICQHQKCWQPKLQKHNNFFIQLYYNGNRLEIATFFVSMLYVLNREHYKKLRRRSFKKLSYFSTLFYLFIIGNHNSYHHNSYLDRVIICYNHLQYWLFFTDKIRISKFVLLGLVNINWYFLFFIHPSLDLLKIKIKIVWSKYFIAS